VIKVRIAELLKTSGKSRYWLAKHTGLTPLAISNLYKEKTQGIDFETLDVICRELGCQPGDILAYINEETKK
jgi:putative transcriptional regulator